VTDLLTLFDRLWGIAQSRHFHVSEWMYWLAALGGGVAIALFGAAVLVPAGVVITVGLLGVGRWRWHRGRARGGLVVALFSSSSSQQGRDREVQRKIVGTLQEVLSEAESSLVHAVPVVVGRDEREFAEALRRRLRGRFVLYGEVGGAGEGRYSVYARVLQPAAAGLIHVNLLTRDVIPSRVTWRDLFLSLTPAEDVLGGEYPLPFTRELEVVVRATAGLVAEGQGDTPRAAALLEEAVAVAPDSPSPQVDFLRAALARTFVRQDRIDEALALLRARASAPDAAPELLRGLADVLWSLPGGRDPRSRLGRESIAVLRAARAQRSDPQRPISTYNLAMRLPDADERFHLLDELLSSEGYYSRAWYVKRERAAGYWEDAVEVWRTDGPIAARPTFKEAARLYSAAIRGRPRITRRGFHLLRHGPAPPLLYLNAADAHRETKHRIRTAWLTRRGTRLRNWHGERGSEALRRRDWAAVANHFHHVAVVRGDLEGIFALTFQAVAARQLGDIEGADNLWTEALALHPDAIVFRAWAHTEHGVPVPELPGEEPVEPAAAMKRVERLRRKRGVSPLIVFDE